MIKSHPNLAKIGQNKKEDRRRDKWEGLSERGMAGGTGSLVLTLNQPGDRSRGLQDPRDSFSPTPLHSIFILLVQHDPHREDILINSSEFKVL